MNAERLLSLYERVADAPDAVARLRRLVLDLAVRGKLVEQDPEDEPASELLHKTTVRSSHRGQTKGSRKKAQSVAARKDLIFEIPAHWEPLLVSQALQAVQTGPFGSSLHKSDYLKGGTPVLNPACIKNGFIVPNEEMAVGPATLERLASFKLRTNDILMARRGEMGRCAVITKREEGWLCGTGSLILRPSDALFPEYLALVVSSPTGRTFLGRTAVGTTMQNLNQSILLRMPFGLPPLSEQRRIVAKVDELMALLDRLESARTKRETIRDRLTSASLARLTAPETTTTHFSSHARFALDVLPALSTRADQMKSLRQTILNLAVRGKLLAQNPEDEPASELLKRIEAEKARLLKAGEIKVRKLQARERSEPIDFRLPKGWVLSELGTVALKVTDGAHKTPTYVEKGVRFVSVKDFSGGKLDLSKTRFIPEAEHQVLYQRCDPRRGDILLGRIGTLGKAVLVDTDVEFSLFVSVGLIRFDHQNLSPEFFRLLLNSPFVEQEFDRIKIGGGTHTNKLNLGDLHTVVLPIPPLAEQHRIVAKVDELMALCDRLEAALSTADTTRSRLLESLIHEALTPSDAIPEVA